MTAAGKDARDGLVLHLGDQCELSLRFFISQTQLAMGAITASIEVATLS